MAVMNRGGIVVGDKSTRKSKGAIFDNLTKSVGAPTGRSESAPGSVGQHCGAMSQQRCDSGTTSTPQQFVHLIGCRDRKGGKQQR
jgi:hypothetical protein